MQFKRGEQVRVNFERRDGTISRLKGKYESNNKWKNNKVVDLYDLSNSNYLYSIYIENDNSNKLRELIVTNDKFYALIGNQLKIYKRNR